MTLAARGARSREKKFTPVPSPWAPRWFCVASTMLAAPILARSVGVAPRPCCVPRPAPCQSAQERARIAFSLQTVWKYPTAKIVVLARPGVVAAAVSSGLHACPLPARASAVASQVCRTAAGIFGHSAARRDRSSGSSVLLCCAKSVPLADTWREKLRFRVSLCTSLHCAASAVLLACCSVIPVSATSCASLRCSG